MHIKNKEGNYLRNAEMLNYIKTKNIPLFMFKQINRRYLMWKIHFPLFLHYDMIQFSQECFSLSIRCISCQSSLTPLWLQFYFWKHTLTNLVTNFYLWQKIMNLFEKINLIPKLFSSFNVLYLMLSFLSWNACLFPVLLSFSVLDDVVLKRT